MNVMPARSHASGKRRVLAEEAVAGVNRVAAALLRGVDDLVDPQVALARGGGPDGVGLVGEAHVERGAIGVGVHGDRADAHLAQRAHDADGDLASVGDEDLAEGRVMAASTSRRRYSGRPSA